MALAINEQLWNAELGVFSLSTSNRTDFSVSSTAFCITSGVANTTQTTRSLDALRSTLALGPGFRDSTQSNASDPATNISPNTNGFLLNAFQGNDTGGLDLMASLWGAMVANGSTASGGSWEYVNAQTSEPGLGGFTSLAHPWGGAATYVLTERALGISAGEGMTDFGYKNWMVGPEQGVAWGLTRAEGVILTAYGSLSVSRRVDEGEDRLLVSVTAPLETTGVFLYRNTQIVLEGKTVYNFTVEGL